MAELKKLAFLRGLEAAGWGPLGNDPQPAQVSGTDEVLHIKIGESGTVPRQSTRVFKISNQHADYSASALPGTLSIFVQLLSQSLMAKALKIKTDSKWRPVNEGTNKQSKSPCNGKGSKRSRSVRCVFRPKSPRLSESRPPRLECDSCRRPCRPFCLRA